MAKLYTHMDETEKRLACRWLKEGMLCSEVAKLLERSKGTIHKLMTTSGLKKPPSGKKAVKQRPKGRPVAITPAIDNIFGPC